MPRFLKIPDWERMPLGAITKLPSEKCHPDGGRDPVL